MANAFVTTGAIALGTVSGTTWTQSYTMGSGTNYGAIVSVFTNGSSAVSTLTYNGVSCTLIAQRLAGSGGRIALFRIENPASGAHDFVASGLTNGTGIWLSVMEYSGVNQTTMTRDASAVTDDTQATTFSNTVNVTGSDSWIVSVLRNDAAFGITANSGITRRFDEQSPTQHAGGDSNGIVSSGNNTVVWNVSNGAHTYGIAVELLAASSSTSVTVTPSALTVTSSIPTYAVIPQTVVTPSAQNSVWSSPGVTVNFGSTIALSAQNTTFSIPAYSILTLDAQVNIDVVTVTSSIPAYTVITNTIVSPNVQSIAWSVPSYLVKFDVLLPMNAQSLLFTLPAIQNVGGIWTRANRSTNSTWTRVPRH